MAVVVRDGRRFSPAAQEDLRRRAVAAVESGKSQAEVSAVLGVSPKTVWRWGEGFRRKGNKGLQTGRRGPRAGEQKALDPRQEAPGRRAGGGKVPPQPGLPPAPVGQTPVIPKTGKRFGVNVMAAISNRGELYFTCYRGSFNGPVFLAYLKRLVGHLDRKIHLIVDGHPVHRRVTVRDWLAKHVAQIEMHFLPGYSPELNPVELLNGDLKHHVAQENPANVAELAAKASAHLRRRQNQPEAVQALFGKPEVRYAAA